MSGKAVVTYQPAPGIAWVQDAGGILLADERAGRSWWLRGAEAAVWDWLSLGYGWAEVAGLLSAFLGVPEAQAEERLRAAVEAWEGEGVLRRRPDEAEPGRSEHPA